MQALALIALVVLAVVFVDIVDNAADPDALVREYCVVTGTAPQHRRGRVVSGRLLALVHVADTFGRRIGAAGTPWVVEAGQVVAAAAAAQR